MVKETSTDSTNDTASILRKNIAPILKKWAAQVEQDIPGSFGRDEQVIINSLSGFMNSLADIISTTAKSTGGERYSAETINDCKEHGRSRAKILDYTLEYMTAEYRMLREILFEFLESERPLLSLEREKLLECIDNGMLYAATEFTLRKEGAKSQVSQADDVSADKTDLKNARNRVEKLESETRNRDAFVSALTHDLRTPLAAAKVTAQIVAKALNDPEFCILMCDRIVKSIDRADKMITDLLDVNLIRSGEAIPLKITETNLSDLAQHVVNNFKATYGERFEYLSTGIIRGYWDREALRRVFENFLTNAIKYGTPKTPISLSLGFVGDDLQFSVHNEGNPISVVDQRSLFRQFRRTTHAHLSGVQGWGLGLTLVRGIVEAHGGSVKVESSPEKGTTFTATIPVIRRIPRSPGRA